MQRINTDNEAIITGLNNKVDRDLQNLENNVQVIIPKTSRFAGEDLQTSAFLSVNLTDIDDFQNPPEKTKYAHILDMWNKDRTQRLAAIEGDILTSGGWSLTFATLLENYTETDKYFNFSLRSDKTATLGGLPILTAYRYSSGYITLFQTGHYFAWGIVFNDTTNIVTVTLPRPFANTNYVVLANNLDNTTTTITTPYTIHTSPISTTTFQLKCLSTVAINSIHANYLCIGSYK